MTINICVWNEAERESEYFISNEVDKIMRVKDFRDGTPVVYMTPKQLRTYFREFLSMEAQGFYVDLLLEEDEVTA